MGRLTAGNEGGVVGWRARRGRTTGSLLRDGGHGLPSSRAGVAWAARRGRTGRVRRRAPFFAGGRGMGGAARARGPRAAARSLLRGQAGREWRGEGRQARAVARRDEGRWAAALLEMDEREREDAR
jgi:hypothetical protein